MKFLAPFLTLALLAGACSTTPPSKMAQWQESDSDRLNRAISSSTDEEALENTYRAIVSDANPAKRMDEYFSRLVRIYYRSENLLRDYDQRLDQMYRQKDSFKSSDLTTDRTYARMMAAWILQNRQIEKISYVYKRNYVEVVGRKDDVNYKSDERERDQSIKRSLMASIKKYGQTERLAMQNLLTHLGEVALEAHQELKVAGENADNKAIAEHTFTTQAAQGAYIQKQRRKSASKIKVALADSSIEDDLNSLEPVVQEHLNEMQQSREPQSAGEVVPSATGKGNLTGNTFRTGRWALTYDDGPSARHTSAILDNLSARNMTTSFFWLSKLTPSYPSLINRTKELGMAMGNHSYSHANLPKQGAASLQKEIVGSTATHERMFGYKPTYFRCPYGACGGNGSNIRQMIANQGMVHIFWNVDSLDWQDKNPASIVSRVKKAMAVAKKGILLFHDIHPQTVEATRMLMDEWVPQVRAGSIRLITIPQAIEELNSDAGMQ